MGHNKTADQSNRVVVNTESGQAVIVLVMIVAIVTILFTHVSLLNLSSLALSNELTEGLLLRGKAEGYLENSAMRYLRDITYTGESLIEGDISCTIVVTSVSSDTKDFQSTCSKSGRSRIVGMQMTLTSGVSTFSKIVQR